MFTVKLRLHLNASPATARQGRRQGRKEGRTWGWLFGRFVKKLNRQWGWTTGGRRSDQEVNSILDPAILLAAGSVACFQPQRLPVSGQTLCLLRSSASSERDWNVLKESVSARCQTSGGTFSLDGEEKLQTDKRAVCAARRDERVELMRRFMFHIKSSSPEQLAADPGSAAPTPLNNN